MGDAASVDAHRIPIDQQHFTKVTVQHEKVKGLIMAVKAEALKRRKTNYKKAVTRHHHVWLRPRDM